MTGPKHGDTQTGVRLLSLLLAGLLWLGVALEGPVEAKFQVPVLLENIPSGLQLASAAPAGLEITVSGPRILLLGLPLRRISCGLDLTGAAAGTASYGAQDCSFKLERELKLVRVHPATIRLTLAKAPPK